MSARNLALSLLSVSDKEPLSLSQLIDSGQLFKIKPAAMRVAVGRLVKDKLIVSPKRGVYLAGQGAFALHARIRSWRTVLQKTTPWSGDWIVTHTAHLGRTDRKQVRVRTRALSLYGFANAESGLYVRPANLCATVSEIRSELSELGLDETAIVMRASELSAKEASNWKALWSATELNTSYLNALDDMKNSLKALPDMNIENATVESLLVGQSVIRAINLDPLLPKEIVAKELLEEMIAGMLDYNETGRQFWKRYFDSLS